MAAPGSSRNAAGSGQEDGPTAQPPSSVAGRTRTVWLLCGEKGGDNTQLRALAAQLRHDHDWHSEEKALTFRFSELASNLLLRTTLLGLATGKAQLTPPWPDLVLTAGRRNEPVARWIVRQNPDTRLVHVGRPWTHPDAFDLVISTPQYTLPSVPNVLTIPLPLHNVTADDLALARDEWHSEFSNYGAPRLAVLVGGNSGPYILDKPALQRLTECITEHQGSHCNSSVLLSTSARTPASVSLALQEILRPQDYFFGWEKQSSSANPYRGLLAWADQLLVTGESMSMLAEAHSTGKPVTIIPMTRRRFSLAWKPLTHNLVQLLAPQRFRRDIERIHQQLADIDPGVNSLTTCSDRIAALFPTN